MNLRITLAHDLKAFVVWKWFYDDLFLLKTIVVGIYGNLK